MTQAPAIAFDCERTGADVSSHPAGPLHADMVRNNPAWPAADDLNALYPGVWPRSVTRVDGVLTIGGMDVRDLSAAHGTPAFLLDEDDFRSRCHDYRAAFGETADVFYAGKAFLCSEVARWVDEEGLGLDVCSGGELAVALRAGFPPARIAFHGSNKSVVELSRAVTAGVGRVVLDSYEEIARLADIATRADRRVKVLVRATVGVEAHTHEYIATAHEDQKFGFSMASGAVLEAARRVLMLPSLELVGLHSHIGSQIFDTAGFEVSAHRVVALLAAIRDEHGVELPEIVLGGGLGIAYTTEDDPLDPKQVAESLRGIVERECAAARLAQPRMSVEPGRAIAGPGTITVYEVGTVKDVDGIRTYVSVDGGMSDNVRTALYGAEYTCALASRRSDAEPMLVRVVGVHCESGDVVVRDAWLPADVAPGDLLAVAGTGAYCRAMASNYNFVPRPPVIAVRAGAAREIVRRETHDDLLRLDIG
ncbi:MAG: diaminopimelate decarboxylase [Pseudonocardiales bacterium]|nr:MAG: diaminopimelate decarboxylase [Pseudonocardiales bacterium]